MGFATTFDDFASLRDIYEEFDEEEHTHRTTYVIQFLLRDLSSKFDVYFTMPSAKFLNGIVKKTMLSFVQFGFTVRALLSDGASSNHSLLKALCGHVDGSRSPIITWFTSPYDGGMIVCPSHQVIVNEYYKQHTHTHTYTHTHIYKKLFLHSPTLYSTVEEYDSCFIQFSSWRN